MAVVKRPWKEMNFADKGERDDDMYEHGEYEGDDDNDFDYDDELGPDDGDFDENLPSDNEDDDEEENEEEIVVEKLKEELSSTSFAELKAMRERMGIKKFDSMMKLVAGDTDNAQPQSAAKKPEEFKRKNRHRPKEVTSKRRMPYLRNVVETGKIQSRDPRFDSLSGNFNEDLFEKSYSFLDGLREAERADVSKKLAKTKNIEDKKELQKALSQMNQADKLKTIDQSRKKLKRAVRKSEAEAVAKGKKPYYLKKSEERKLEMIGKYKAIKETGKLQDYIKKKRRKNAAKDHRFVPYERR